MVDCAGFKFKIILKKHIFEKISYMKKLFPIFILVLLLSITSCQTRVVSVQKPMKDNSLELYQKYTIQTNDAKITKMQVLKVDEQNIYGKTKTGESVTINRVDVREVKKLELLPSIAIGVAAIAAVIIVPI
ncbi:bacteriophage spanin2 family protein [uncultured Chryseobacterium sp.]|uniref:bacteriophage spanin2 family protein n=1 Tax=uncultured Chryseobacterium sp. TaxID=259322 RepID=UPI00345B944C